MCITPPPLDLDCPEVPYTSFRVVGADPRGFDPDGDGLGCEPYPPRAQGATPLKKYLVDAVVSGTVCMDKYEASVWWVPGPTASNKGFVKKVQQGKATVADLTKSGAMPLGTASESASSRSAMRRSVATS